MEKRSYYTATAFLLLCTFAASGQIVKPVRVTQYTQNEGLSSFYVTKIIQDKYGFLWVGTQEGLNLFDGIRFKIFSAESIPKHNIGGSFIADLAEDKKKSLLWVLPSYGDICAIDLATRTIERKLTLDREGKKFSEKWLRALHLQGDILWIAGLNSISAYHVTENRFLDIDQLEKSMAAQGEYNISRIVGDNLGRTWFFSEGSGVVVVGSDLRPIKSFRDKDLVIQSKQKLLFREAMVHGDSVYAATSWGLLIFNTGKAGHVPTVVKENLLSPADHTEVRGLAFAEPSTLLFSTPSRIYAANRKTGKVWEIKDENPDNIGLQAVFQIYYDSLSEKVWTGSQSGLSSFSLKESAFQAFSKSNIGSTKIKQLYGVLPINADEVYCAGENGVYRVDTRTREIVRMDTSSANFMLFADARKNIFLSNLNGLHLIRNKKLVPARMIFPELGLLDRDHLSSGVQYNDSLILFASAIQKGLYVWNNRSHSLTTFHNDSVPHAMPGLSIINFLAKTNGQDVFVLTEKSAIRFNPVTGEHHSHQIQNDSSAEPFNFMDMCETDDSYWFATYGDGLIETDKELKLKRIISVRDGLSNNHVYRVFNHNNESIIATSNNGLSIVNAVDYTVNKYFQADGLHGNAFEQLCGYASNGKIYAGGAGGFTRIDPTRVIVNKNPPTLYMQDIKVEALSGTVDTCHLAIDQIIVPNDALQTTIHFTALNYQNPKRISYEYRIEGLTDEWVNVGSQNFVNLIGISPGTYRFQVKALNEGGLSTAPLSVMIRFLPKWYQTAWFRFVLLLSGALAIYGIQLYRISQIRKQQQIRKEIANDLHDDIGSTLNSLKIFAHLAQRDTDNKSHIVQIEDSVSTATVSLRDMIWVLDDDQDSLYELMERIKRFALPICMANDIKLATSVKADSGNKISKKAKRNLLLIAKESVNNAIKYSACTNIQVVLTQTKNSVILRIEDDGKGFDMGTMIPGKGLASIRYRASQISFKCDIISLPTQGTRIELSGKA